MAYIEWGTRLAVPTHNSSNSHTSFADAEVGWGIPGGPYRPES